MANEIRIDSTTNTPEEVSAALGIEPPAAPAEKPVKAKPAVKPKAEAPAAPPEKPADEKPEKPDADDDEEPEEEEEELTPEEEASRAGRALAKRKYAMSKRVRKLVIQKNTAATERETALKRMKEMEAELETLRSLKPPAAPDSAEKAKPAAPADDGLPKFFKPEPKEDDYDTYEKFVEAKIEWRIEKHDFEKDQQLALRHEQEARETEARTAQAKLKERFTKAKEKYADFDEVMDAAKDLPISVVVRDHLRFSESGAELAYYLSTNPEEAERISNLQPGVALVELGKLETRLEMGTIGAASDAPPKRTATPIAAETARVPVSKAPAPIARPAGGGGQTTKPLDQEDYQTYKQRRNAELAAKNGR